MNVDSEKTMSFVRHNMVTITLAKKPTIEIVG